MGFKQTSPHRFGKGSYHQIGLVRGQFGNVPMDGWVKFIQESGIPEQIKIGASQGSDNLHEEFGIDALMALADPKSIRIDQRKKANRATINGVSLLPMEKTIEMGKKIVELRTRLTVDAIQKAMAASKTSQQD